MKRYLLFAGDSYYPGGGWNDYISSGDDWEELKKSVGQDFDWIHILDTTTMQLIPFTDIIS